MYINEFKGREWRASRWGTPRDEELIAVSDNWSMHEARNTRQRLPCHLLRIPLRRLSPPLVCLLLFFYYYFVFPINLRFLSFHSTPDLIFFLV